MVESEVSLAFYIGFKTASGQRERSILLTTRNCDLEAVTYHEIQSQFWRYILFVKYLWPSNSFVIIDFQIGGVLSSNMEQLNKKRTDLRNQQKVLNDKIGKSEEKKLFLENKKGVLESRRDELNCKSQVFDF